MTFRERIEVHVLGELQSGCVVVILAIKIHGTIASSWRVVPAGVDIEIVWVDVQNLPIKVLEIPSAESVGKNQALVLGVVVRQ